MSVNLMTLRSLPLCDKYSQGQGRSAAVFLENVHYEIYWGGGGYTCRRFKWSVSCTMDNQTDEHFLYPEYSSNASIDEGSDAKKNPSSDGGRHISPQATQQG